MWTLYTQGDVLLLNAIFNEVAMIGNNTALVWGFALFASFFIVIKSTLSSTLETHRQAGGPVLAKSMLHMAGPMVLAMVLTSPDAKITLTVENTVTGVTTQIDHVPIAIAAIPVAGSAMANVIGPAITTAMTGVNPAYGDITVSGHGFIDPMRRLLAARGAIEHLGAVDTELRIVLGRCLSMDAGTDFTALNNLVMNAGNTGATAAQSIPVNGANPTGVGALLYQAAQNTTGLVPELAIGNSTILNCPDAASRVATDITAALQSAEFPRVVQGAVNGLDQPLPNADYSMTQFQNEYLPMRNWKSMSATLAVGQAQANAELINFLFDEEVTGALNCAQASESNKTICEATMIQATELERNNLQAAANEVPMLEYAGAFGNYILALIIGLGPVIVMFMMLFGIDGGKCIKTCAHIMVWPLLVTNVGAELVNAMLTMQFSNFMSSLAQGGYLSPAAVHNAYKELSLQVGVGSHIMASLPVLMSMVFALGEGAAMASVSAEITPKGNETGKDLAPSPFETAPLMRATSLDTDRQFESGGHSIEAEGKRDAASTSSTLKSLTRGASQTVTDAESRESRESADRSSVHRFAEALAHRNYATLGLNWSQGEALNKELSNNLREGGQDQAQVVAGTNRGNARSANLGASGGLSSSAGSSGLGASGSVGLSGGANASASESQSLGESVQRTSDLNLAKAVSKTLSGNVGKQVMDSTGGERSKALSNERSAADSYVESLTHRNDHTSAIGHALQESDGFVAANQTFGAAEIVQQAAANDEFRHFQRMDGSKFADLPGASKHLALAERDMSSRSTEDIGGDVRGRAAVARHMAATSMVRDTSLPEAARFQALKYLVGENNAMQRGNFDAPSDDSFKSQAKPIELPKDATGVAPAILRQHATAATRGVESLADPQEHVDPKAKVRLGSQHGAAEAAADLRLPGVGVPDGRRTSDAVDSAIDSARQAGLVDGPDAKNVLSRTWGAWFHSDTAGAAAKAPSEKDSNGSHEHTPTQ